MYVQPSSSQKGPIRNRKCTDVFCMILFLCFILFIAAVSIFSYIQGDTNKIAQVIDSDQKICGENERANYPYIYVNDPFSMKFYENTVCVKSCPSTDKSKIECFANNDVKKCSDLTVRGSVLLASRLCVPKVKQIANNVKMAMNLSYVQESLEDIREVWPMIILGVFFGIVILVIYICLMRYCAKCFVFTMLILVLVGLVLLGIFCWREYKIKLNENADASKVQNDPSTTADADDPSADISEENATEYGQKVAKRWKTAAIVLWVLSGVFLILSLLLCSRIELAADLLSSASEFVQSESSVFLIPVTFSILMVILFVWWIPTFAMVTSMGETSPDPTSVFMNLNWSTSTTVFICMFIFALLWFVSFNFSQETFSIAAMTASWYFERFDESNVGAFTAICWSFWYHVGTLAFGSLLIAILWAIQLILQYIYQKMKEIGMENTGAAFLLKCAMCFVACFERTIKFINKHAYIEVALRNINFCAAAGKCLEVTTSNFLRFGVLSGLSGLFLFLGDLIISCTATFIMFFIIRWYAVAKDLEIDTLAPHALIFFIVLFICIIFSGVFEISADTLLHCYIYDEEDGTVDGFIGSNAPHKLKETIDKHSAPKDM